MSTVKRVAAALVSCCLSTAALAAGEFPSLGAVHFVVVRDALNTQTFDLPAFQPVECQSIPLARGGRLERCDLASDIEFMIRDDEGRTATARLGRLVYEYKFISDVPRHSYWLAGTWEGSSGLTSNLELSVGFSEETPDEIRGYFELMRYRTSYALEGRRL